MSIVIGQIGSVKESKKELQPATSEIPVTLPPNAKKRKLEEANPGTATESAITDDSKAVYMIYTIRSFETSDVVAVLIKAKTTHHARFKHGLAHVSSQFSW